MVPLTEAKPPTINPSFLSFPPELRRQIYDYLRPPCSYLLDKSHPKAIFYEGFKRMPMYSEPFTIPAWTFNLGLPRVSHTPDYLVGIRTQLALASTCKKLRSETLGELFARYTFTVTDDTDDLSKVRRFLCSIGPASRRALRLIDIQGGVSPLGLPTNNFKLLGFAYRNFVTPTGAVIAATHPVLSHFAVTTPPRPSEEEEGFRPDPQEISILEILLKYQEDFDPHFEIKIRLNPEKFPPTVYYWGYGPPGWELNVPCLKRAVDASES
ncbi:MAG: hypothetical protein Q9165_008116 [Trypethelium subeluteriae]